MSDSPHGRRWMVVLGSVMLVLVLAVPLIAQELLTPRVYVPLVAQNPIVQPTPRPTNTPTPTPANTPIPGPTNTPVVPTPTVTPTTPPAPTGSADIVTINYDPPGDEVAGEYVDIRNVDTRTIDMTGWRLSDIANHIFTFPSFHLPQGATVRIWTKSGTNDASNLYWGSGSAIWNNEGDFATLVRSDGSFVDDYEYP